MSSPIQESIDNIELRVVKGPQSGAVLPLTGEDIIIGSGRQCDVILQSPQVSLRHAQLSVTADNFSLNAIDEKITTSIGAPAAPPWQFGTTIYLGDVGITVARSTTKWEDASPPQITVTRQITGNGARWQKDLIRHWKRFAVLAAVLVSLSVIAQWIPGLQAATAKYNLSPADIHAINTLIANQGRDAQLKVSVTEGRATIRGFLPGKVQINALHRDLSKWARNLTIDVQAEDGLLAASRHFLIQEHSPLKVTIANGQALLSGLDSQREDVNRLALDLRKNVDGLAGVNATFVDRPRLEAWLRTWRKDMPSLDRNAKPLQIETNSAGDLELHGSLPAPRIELLRETLTRHSLQKNMLLALHIAITTPSALDNQPPIVRAFSAGSVPYVFLTTGKRVMIGGAVDGFQLIAINAEGPVFEKQEYPSSVQN
jgi:type III secretion system YscD/HrpQ family protein